MNNIDTESRVVVFKMSEVLRINSNLSEKPDNNKIELQGKITLGFQFCRSAIGIFHLEEKKFLSRLDIFFSNKGKALVNRPTHRKWANPNFELQRYERLSERKISGPHKNIYFPSKNKSEILGYAYIPKDLELFSFQGVIRSLMEEWNIKVRNQNTLDFNPFNFLNLLQGENLL